MHSTILGTWDFSAYWRVNETSDPHPTFAEPAFSEAPFAEGNPLLSVDVKNREMVFPLFLKSSSRDALHALAVAAEAACRQPDLVFSYRDEGATQITYYDVAYAHFDPAYNEQYGYRRAAHGWLAGYLRIFCAPPYGHTGTYRSVVTQTGTGAQFVPIPSAIQGDADALTRIIVQAGSYPPVNGARDVLIAALPHPSWAFTASLVSQFYSGSQADVMAEGGWGIAPPNGIDPAPFSARLSLGPVGPYVGKRIKLFGLAAAPQDLGRFIVTKDRFGNLLGPTQVASVLEGFQFVSFGEMSVPSSPRGTTLEFAAYFGGPNLDPITGASYLGQRDWRGTQLDAVFAVPADKFVIYRDQSGAPVPVAGDDFRALVGQALANGSTFLNILSTPGYNDLFGNPYILPSVRPMAYNPGGWTAGYYGWAPWNWRKGLTAQRVGMLNGSLSYNVAAIAKQVAPPLRLTIWSNPAPVQSVGALASQAVIGRLIAPNIGTTADLCVRYGGGSLPFFCIERVPGTPLASIAASRGTAGQSSDAVISLTVDPPNVFANLYQTGTKDSWGTQQMIASIGLQASVFDDYKVDLGVICASIGYPPFPPAIFRWQLERGIGDYAKPKDIYVHDPVMPIVMDTASVTRRQLAANAVGALPAINPSTAAIGVMVAGREGGVSGDWMAVDVRVRERFTVAR